MRRAVLREQNCRTATKRTDGKHAKLRSRFCRRVLGVRSFCRQKSTVNLLALLFNQIDNFSVIAILRSFSRCK